MAIEMAIKVKERNFSLLVILFTRVCNWLTVE